MPRFVRTAVSIRSVNSLNEPAGISDEFSPASPIVVDRPLYAGQYGIQVNGQICDGRFTVSDRNEADLLLSFLETGCAIQVTGSHPEGAITHSNESAAIIARVPIGASLMISVAGTGPSASPRTIQADEAGSITVDSLPPGRYDLSVQRDGAVISMLEVELTAGSERFVDFTSCGEIACPS